MAQFEGSTNKVRCADCSSLVNGRCSVRDAKVSSKKRRSCSRYVFKGEYSNREGVDVTYYPHMSKKTRQLMKKYLRMNIHPMNVDGSSADPDLSGYQHVKTLPMPTTTASAPLVDIESANAPLAGGELKVDDIPEHDPGNLS